MMAGKYKRRLVSCVEEEEEADIISNLTQHLVDSIFERLPIEDAVRTSIISKNWRYRWTKMSSLVFDEHFSKKFAKNGAFGHNGFIRIITQILILHNGPILKFHLHIPNIFLDSFQEVNQFMLLLSRNGVKDLVLTNSNRRYEISSHVFSCLELTKLKLVNCFFKPPLAFEGFLNLEHLDLENIDFGASLCGTNIRLPRLKKLSLLMCTHVYNFNIKATKLQSLTVICCPDAMLLRLLDSQCLRLVVFAVHKPIEDIVQGENMTFARIFCSLPRVEYFAIDSEFFKVLAAEKIPKLLPCPISSLKSLRLLDFQLGDLDQLHGVLCLLRNSSNLESLYMMRVQERQVDVGPAVNHLEAPNCLDCTLSQLQTVEILKLQGSKPELLFIKILLAHSPSLKNFTIKPNGASDVKKRLDIAKDVMQFPRASTNAKVFYLDPGP